MFLLLGSSTPLSTYFMPQILENFGGLPEGAVIDIPTPTGTEVLAQTLSDFGLLGVLVLTLALMGIVSAGTAERSSSDHFTEASALLFLSHSQMGGNYLLYMGVTWPWLRLRDVLHEPSIRCRFA